MRPNAIDVMAREIIELQGRLVDANQRVAELEAKVAELSTPNMYGVDDWAFESLSDWGNEASPGVVGQVWANRTLGYRWLAYVPKTWDEDGSVDECEVEEFETQADAMAAVATAIPPVPDVQREISE